MSEWPDVKGPDPATEPALAELLRQLRESHRDGVDAILLYGSCLRSGDIFDGLVDLYLVVEDYRSAYGNGWLAIANWLLPPNVFYAQATVEDRVLRSKVTVISRRDFRQGCSASWFQSYIWGRFSQPVRIIFAKDSATRTAIKSSLGCAVQTLLNRALPALPTAGPLTSLWEGALGLSYATELRTERPGRARELVLAAADFYTSVTVQAAANPGQYITLSEENGILHYRSETRAGARRVARFCWWLRRAQGKLLSVLRLIKALFTFTGGLDYIAWKLERHSGQKIDIPPRVRKHPLLFSWRYFWGLYRRGIFK